MNGPRGKTSPPVQITAQHSQRTVSYPSKQYQSTLYIVDVCGNTPANATGNLLSQAMSTGMSVLSGSNV